MERGQAINVLLFPLLIQKRLRILQSHSITSPAKGVSSTMGIMIKPKLLNPLLSRTSVNLVSKPHYTSPNPTSPMHKLQSLKSISDNCHHVAITPGPGVADMDSFLFINPVFGMPDWLILGFLCGPGVASLSTAGGAAMTTPPKMFDLVPPPSAWLSMSFIRI